MIKWFLSLLLLMCCITFTDLCWTTTASLGWSWLDCGEWSFWYFVGSVCHYFIEDFCIDVH
jgi:hypothetical protein